MAVGNHKQGNHYILILNLCLYIVFFITSHTKVRFRFIVFNATFNNISVISWWSVFLVEETGVLGEETTDLLQVTDKSLIIL